ncbi:glyoxylase-like metal-dependent hydrolase (beta-lactamase superfamily II) [Lewinella aquimaris]|uniref:Glyoxylase-like metal-dependent hydrolase (Beta-lactamase superfamily II) n=1 Tax=Neolewinella aquimaris TaxID=1835722 RepID=A0A840E4S5_9BACT|nr:MBL fold metallo-hydrolase [Neolewinella aquimaris]MBB4078953.1 glyoxylase-like metal-dependent hydrolase (beta-lactamase superfamily II) [Neolewinella aquimaris]
MTNVLALTQNPVQENTYLVYDTDTKEAIIFDPGCFTPAEERELVATIDELGLKPVHLINTHCHFDHVFGNAFVMDRYGLKLGIHPLEEQVLEAAPMIVQAYGMPPMTPSPKPDYFINEGDTVSLGETTFEVLFCPGHSPGSICFYNRTEGYVIAGDVLFRRSIGRTDLPLGDHDALIGSILTKLMPLPDETVVYPGHGPSTTIGEERRENPFL